MRIVLLHNNDVARPLGEWLRDQGEDVVFSVDHEDVREDRAPLVLSYCYREILDRKFLNAPWRKCINLHTSYLPYGRGAHPLVWAALNGTPMGVTIHWMTEKLDGGEMIARTPMQYRKDETLAELYTRAHELIRGVFKKDWWHIRGKVGDYHRASEIGDLVIPNKWDTTVAELREANK